MTSLLGPEISVPSGSIVPSNIRQDANGHATVGLPEPITAPSASAKAVFLCGKMQAIVAWNGKTDAEGEQILILSGEFVSAETKNEAVLGIIPLPDNPISIKRSSIDMNAVKTAIEKKIEKKTPSGGRVVPVKVEPERSVADHSVFVLKFENEADFLLDIRKSLASVYSSGVDIDISTEDVEVIKKYVEKGMFYFAFNLAPLGQWPAQKASLAFHFKTKSAYYPLAINKIGGTGHSLIDLVVMTPGMIKLQGAFEKGKEEVPVVVKGRTSISWSTDEIKLLTPELSEFFEKNGLESVRARNFLFETENIDQFLGDFVAVPIEE